jgi:probable lipoprotein NlpC
MSQERLKAYSKYVGVPYVSKGRTPAGWDCYGLYLYVVAEMLAVEVPSYSDEYASAENKDAVADAMRAYTAKWRPVPAGQEAEGDGVVFYIGGLPVHCGYVIERGTMLHALRGRGTVIERYTGLAWNKRTEGFYRWNS